MADVTINNLSPITPSTGLVLPVSNGSTTGKVTLSQVCGVMTSAQITTALGYTPYNSSNPAGYITAASLPSSNQLIKAWVNWKGNVYNAQNECTLNSSYNISKVVRSGNGAYEVYFSSSSIVPNVYYTIQGGAIGIAGAGSRYIAPGSPYYNNVKKTTSSFTVDCTFTFTAREDASEAWVTVV